MPADIDPSLIGLHRELERGFEFWNRACFQGRLPPVVFAFFPQPSNGSAGRLGHYLPASWEVAKKERAAEIVFYADLCLAAGAEEVFLTLVHEMVHHWQQLEGKPGKKVHNAEWHQKAAEVGLVTSGPKGLTTAGAEFTQALRRFSPRVETIPFRLLSSGRRRQKGKMRRWSCPLECNGSIRSGKETVFLICGVCNEPLKPDEDGAGDEGRDAA